jgi:hypothetical protein
MATPENPSATTTTAQPVPQKHISHGATPDPDVVPSPTAGATTPPPTTPSPEIPEPEEAESGGSPSKKTTQKPAGHKK